MSDDFKFLGQSIPNFAIICGGILILWGIASYAISDTGSITALIGTPLLVLGFVSIKNQENKHHYMHACMIFAMISVLGGLRIFSLDDASSLTLASHVILIIIGQLFLVGGILSFRHARKLHEMLGSE
jgi:uncharacterized membrane protein HdeD (DUF308 family)